NSARGRRDGYRPDVRREALAGQKERRRETHAAVARAPFGGVSETVQMRRISRRSVPDATHVQGQPPQRLELRELEFERRGELPIGRRIGGERLRVRESLRDVHERFLAARNAGEFRLWGRQLTPRGSNRIRVRVLLGGEDGPELRELFVVDLRCGESAVERRGALLEHFGTVEHVDESHWSTPFMLPASTPRSHAALDEPDGIIWPVAQRRKSSSVTIPASCPLSSTT